MTPTVYALMAQSTSQDPGIILTLLIADKDNLEAMDANAMHDEGLSLAEMEPAPEFVLEQLHENSVLMITKDFWTCNCSKAYVHHVDEFVCPRCNCTKVQHTERHRFVDEALGWKTH